MKLDLSQDHSISLKRHDKKLWSYKDNRPDVVEAAVLDYLRDNGFDGYFTERDHYLLLFQALAAWHGKMFKRMPPWFTGPSAVFYLGSDGYLKRHKFSYAQAMAEVEATTIEGLTEKIKNFCTSKTLRKFCSDRQEQPDHMLRFLKILGIENLKRGIKEIFTQEELEQKRFLYEFDTKMIFLRYERKDVLKPDGLLKNIQSQSLFYGVRDDSRSASNIEQTEQYAEYVREDSLRNEILNACTFARELREKAYAKIKTAKLDLQIWDETGTAIVEVKAPNDQLTRSQTNTIESARQSGERACVIYVSSSE